MVADLTLETEGRTYYDEAPAPVDDAGLTMADDAASGEADPTPTPPMTAAEALHSTALHTLSLLSTDCLITASAYLVWTLTGDDDDPPELYASDTDIETLGRGLQTLAALADVLIGDEQPEPDPTAEAPVDAAEDETTDDPEDIDDADPTE
ncbi:MAG: hypothetical protein AB7U18_27680 [Dehalococcoidia bacterium]